MRNVNLDGPTFLPVEYAFRTASDGVNEQVNHPCLLDLSVGHFYILGLYSCWQDSFQMSPGW
jgi:hypothetical protein